LEEAVAEGTVAGGSVLVLQQGKVIYERGFGFADIESKAPFLVESPAVVASISKPLLGTTAFRLAQEDKLDLSAPISEYLPEFAPSKLESGKAIGRKPTMIELFTHTSGMRGDSATGGRPWFAKWVVGKPLSEVVSRFAGDFPFKAEPGEKYSYCGIGTDVAARVLEVATKRPRNELFVSELSRPLGMKSTFFRDAEGLSKVGKMPTRYYRSKDGKLVESKRRAIPAKNTYSSSGGSVISTAPDLARWLLMIRNGGLHEGKPFLKRETNAKLLSAFPRSSNAQGGLFIRKSDASGKAVVVGHTGSSGTNCWIDFEIDAIGIMLTQTRGKDIKPFRIELEKLITKAVAR